VGRALCLLNKRARAPQPLRGPEGGGPLWAGRPPHHTTGTRMPCLTASFCVGGIAEWVVARCPRV